jgi:MerC mercury resistance protein
MSSFFGSCFSFAPASRPVPPAVPRRRMIGDVLQSSRNTRLSLLHPYTALTSRDAIYCSAVNTNDMAEEPKKNGRWNDRLLQFSNIASFLCVLDCTILPVLMVLLPLLGMVSSAGGAASTAWLHAFGHQLTLYVVLPLGTLATSINFTSHKKKWITALGWCGLLLIALANSGGGCGHSHHAHATAQSLWARAFPLLARTLHVMQHGIYHRVVNLSGCALLIGSNFLSYRRQKQHQHSGACCAGTPGEATTKPV